MAMTSAATFGALLRHHRLKAGLTQEELAERAGVSARGVQQLERDRTAPRAETLRLLADALVLSAEARAELITAAHPELATPVAPASVPLHLPNLAVPPTPLVGREREVAAACAMLRRSDGAEGTRLVTLTGPGGVGKTRLAMAVAAQLTADFRDGAIWVDLGPIRDPALVPAAVARALGVLETGDRPLAEMLVTAVARRHLLLVLDNLEHMLEAAPLIAELLAAAPQLAVLATSRARLRLRGEREFPVPPLAVPAAEEAHMPLREVAAVAAVRLFVERAGEVQPGFTLTNENADDVIDICRRLDGLPLAIELAAARIKVLPPAELRHRLRQRLPLLSGGARDLPLRQQTMRGAIAWSHDLLNEEEQALFRKLAVFAGGCTLAAAERVFALGSPALGQEPVTGSRATSDVVDLVASLIDQSLLRTTVTAMGEPRYAMLGTVRDYGIERLHECGEDADARRAHAAYYLALAERAEPELTGPSQARWLEQLAIEHDNLRAALIWSLDGADARTAVCIVGALWRFWWLRGYLSEGRTYAEAAAAQDGGTAAERAKALYAAGSLAQEQGDYGPAAPLLEAGMAAAKQAGDHEIAALCLNELGFIARDQGDYQRAVAFHEEALALHRATGDRRGAAVSLGNLGEIAIDRGDYERGEELMAEVAAVFRELGDQQALATALSNRCDAATRRGDHERARPFCEEALTVYRVLEDRQRTAMALMSLTRVARGIGDWRRAAAVGGEALDLARDMGLKRLTAEALNSLGAVALAEDDSLQAAAYLRESLELLRLTDNKEEIAAALETVAQACVGYGSPEPAARLHGAAAELRERIGAPIPPAERDNVDRAVSRMQTALGHEQLAAAEAAGHGLTLEQAITEALAMAEKLAQDPG
jgi:predicted ATPase/DNA-binding XRE family transcriptional regulator